jgi:hypothetical protein
MNERKKERKKYLGKREKTLFLRSKLFLRLFVIGIFNMSIKGRVIESWLSFSLCITKYTKETPL